MTYNREKFKALLDDQYLWPCEYLFKFIVPVEEVESLLALFPDIPLEEKLSNSGKYTSVTVRKICLSSDHVMELYQKAGTIKGIISL